MSVVRVLTIAGSDSGGGAGIQADLKTFFARKVYGMSVITSVTAQNTIGVQGVADLDAEFVALQLESVLSDIGVDAVKIGMLSNSEIISAVADKLEEYKVEKIVLDPVMVAKGGDPLLQPEAVDALITRLIPLALLVTPNISETKVLSNMEIFSIEDMIEAARRICDMGAKHTLIKGGHLQGEAVDILFDGQKERQYSAQRIITKNTHGTGCTLSSAITAELAKGYSLPDAVQAGKDYVTKAIQTSLEIGVGHGPLNHWA